MHRPCVTLSPDSPSAFRITCHIFRVSATLPKQSFLAIKPCFLQAFDGKQSFASHFIFSSSNFTTGTVQCRWCCLHFIPFCSSNLVVCSASRPAARCMWVTTKRSLSSRLNSRKCFPCVMAPCTMELHVSNNCQQEGGHIAERYTRPAKAAMLFVQANITSRFGILICCR